MAGVDDGLQARTAQAVYVEGRRALAAAATDGRNAREVHIFGLGVDHMAEDHMAHVLTVYLRAGQRFAHHLRGQLGGRDVFEAAAKSSNSGTHRADYNYFTGHGFSLVSKIKSGGY